MNLLKKEWKMKNIGQKLFKTTLVGWTVCFGNMSNASSIETDKAPAKSKPIVGSPTLPYNDGTMDTRVLKYDPLRDTYYFDLLSPTEKIASESPKSKDLLKGNKKNP
jgi:hypothetical protein